MSWMNEIAEHYGQEYILRQAAEEAAGLCQAALRCVRVMRDETPVKWTESQKALMEGIVDVELMLHIVKTTLLNDEANDRMARIYADKEDRMRYGLLEQEG